MHDVKDLMKDHYLRYASYVILDRAIPDLVDGLKPVQRRILHTLFKVHDGKFHKVANISGQTMALHPHGDAPINEALVGIANKGYLLDCQGNFGNTLTGDSAAAARYIETRLSKLAVETMFNPKLTEFIPSYDGRNQEPVSLPAKLPLLLMQGTEGIAVGMATKIFPHNFQELIRAEIAVLKNESFELFPDFLTGGIMDASEYDKGRGKIRLRAKLEAKDQKTIVIKEVCASTTTESVIQSIEEAAKRGRIKIESIRDYTAEEVAIEIHLPRSVYAKDVIPQLYAFTECEVSLSSQMVVIADGMPKEITVDEAIIFYVEKLKYYLQRELEIELEEVHKTIFQRNLERIFIENKLYSLLEDLKEEKLVYGVMEKAFKPYHKELAEEPTKDDFDMLLRIPIRRIAKFDRDKNVEECKSLAERETAINKSLQGLTKYTIRYLEGLLKKYGELFPRRTEIKNLEVLDKRSMEKKDIEVGVDLQGGYIGMKVVGDETISCTTLDKLLVFLKDGTYKVLPIQEKSYVSKPDAPFILALVADKQQVISCIYKNKESGISFCKRFIVKQFILEKEYSLFEENCELLALTKGTETYLVQFLPRDRQRVGSKEVDPAQVPIKGVSAHGNRISPRPVLAIRRVGQNRGR